MDTQIFSQTRTFTRNNNRFCANDATPADAIVVGWMATAQNTSVGFTLSTLEDFEVSWLENNGIAPTNVFRASGDRVTTLVQINCETGTVRFFDNEHHVETGGMRFQRATPFRRVIFAETFHQARFGFEVL